VFSISTETHYQASHSLTLEHTREPVHSHDWRVRVTVQSKTLDSSGLVMDFHKLKRLLEKTVEPYQNRHPLNDLPAFQNYNPSTERIAEDICNRLNPLLPGGLSISLVEVWEFPDCKAAFRPE